LELLEDRRMLDAVGRDGGGDGTSWDDPLNWDTKMLPGPSDDVTIDVQEEVSLAATGSITIASLVNAETLQVGDAALSVTNSLTNTGSVVSAILTVCCDASRFPVTAFRCPLQAADAETGHRQPFGTTCSVRRKAGFR